MWDEQRNESRDEITLSAVRQAASFGRKKSQQRAGDLCGCCASGRLTRQHGRHQCINIHVLEDACIGVPAQRAALVCWQHAGKVRGCEPTHSLGAQQYCIGINANANLRHGGC